VNEIRVTTWLELQDELFANAWHEELDRFRSDFAFRGEADMRNDLRTSLPGWAAPTPRSRRTSCTTSASTPGARPSRRTRSGTGSPWPKHHGLSTRLLDWTYSPYVALHFLTASGARYDVDGALWCVNFVKANRRLPARLMDVLEEEGANTFTAEMLGRAAPSLAEFDSLGSDDFVVFFEPPSLDDRIVNQSALFSLMPSPHAQLDRWLEAHPDVLRRIVVPAELKWEIRHKLDQANVTERVLFPGLDGPSRWLARDYGPRDAL
jgi:hypothetical protein